MQLFSELKLEEKRLKNMTNTANIQFDDEAILSTVAKRAHREAIKIVNAARKKYGEFETIVIETAREKIVKKSLGNTKNFKGILASLRKRWQDY
ncbi:hypothetical protein ACI2OX_16845 [Bacillus sp. N9]